jgi:hypothetical protein
MKRIIICVIFFISLSAVFAKRQVKIDRLKDITKKVYVSVEAQSMFNFLEGLKLPFKNNGITFCVTPSIKVDYYLGSYFFVGGGVSFNTAGGDYEFLSSRINDMSSLGFSSSGIASRTISVSYIELPFYVKIQSNYMNNWAVQGLLGFSWGVRVLSSYKDVYSDFTYTNNQIRYLNGKYEEQGSLGKKASLWTVSGIAEIRALYRAMEKLQLFVGIGFQGGLANILSKKNTANEQEFHSGKPGQAVVSAGIVF